MFFTQSHSNEGMGRTPVRDKRIDAYIDKSADFAKPVLAHLRKLVHRGCPDVEETMKWSFPHFDYKGMMCSMASFKQHCVFGFWKASLMKDPNKLFSSTRSDDAMGQFGRIQSIKDLPANAVMLKYIREAVRLNDMEKKLPVKPRPAIKKTLKIPTYFTGAVRKNKKAWQTFQNFSYSNRKEYVEWVTEAKTEETRKKRLETAVRWMSEGKGRNWKYEKK